MWRITLRLSDRKPFISACIASWLSSIALFLKGDCIGIIIALCLVGLGVLGLILIMLLPLKNEIPPLDYAVKHSQIVWGLWFTGDRHFDLIQRYNSIKKILLMKPDSLAFKTSTNNPDRSQFEIKRLTLRAIQKGVPIRWYSEPQESSLTIYDPIQNAQPFSNKAYYIVSKLEKGIPRKDRILHMQKRKLDEDDFNAQVDRFNQIWNNSFEPKPEEYKQDF